MELVERSQTETAETLAFWILISLPSQAKKFPTPQIKDDEKSHWPEQL